MPVSSLTAGQLEGLEFRPDDRLIARLDRPSAPMLISGELAELIEAFRNPSTVFEAASALAKRRGLEVRGILDEGQGPLDELIRSGILRPATESAIDSGSPTSSKPALFAPGDQPLEGVRIRHLVHRLDGTEIYAADLAENRLGALKIQRRPSATGNLDRERVALRRLQGYGAPELYAHGRLDSMTWMLRRWIDGVDVLQAGRSARREDRVLGAGGARVLDLLRRIARTFAAAHSRGVLHGDVHHGNVMVDACGEVFLIDFALSRSSLKSPPAIDGPHLPAPSHIQEKGGAERKSGAERAGSFLAMEPEQARALLDGRGAIPVTPPGEQFAVGALLYETASGLPYMNFRLDRQGLLAQIADARPLPFAEHGTDPWPDLESILARALAADPAQRFPDMGHFAGALERLPPRRRRRRSRPRLPVVARRLRRRLRLLSRIDDDLGPSVYDGAAGVAYALLRLAAQLERPSALAAAETWLDAAKSRSVETARKKRIGKISPFHTQSGVAVVEALLADALGDLQRQAGAVQHFLELSKPGGELELMLGRAGNLLAAARLHELELDAMSRGALENAGESWSSSIRLGHRRRGPVGEAPLDQVSFWGLAHGFAGELYALLRWSWVLGKRLSPQDKSLLDELAGAARARGRGRMWPQPAGGPLSGWCHGSAGYVFLWHAAAELADDVQKRHHYRELADLAAWDAYEGPGENGTLCCGLAGRAWSLLHHFRRSGDEIWRHRASALAEAATTASFPDPATSLFKGELALVLLDAELHGSGAMGFPFLEGESQRRDACFGDSALAEVAGGSQETGAP